MLFLLTAAFVFLNMEDVRHPLTVLRTTEKSLLALEGYQYTTDERGNGYNVSFQGYLSDNKLVGRIKEYDMYIYLEKNGLYVKSEDAKEWVEATSQGLANVECLLMGPADVLKKILAKENKQNMYFKEEGRVIDIPYEANENALAKALFPGISSSSIKNFHVTIWIDEEESLQKIEMTMHMVLPDFSEEVISRSITLDYVAGPDVAYPDI